MINKRIALCNFCFSNLTFVKDIKLRGKSENSLVVQWLGPRALTAGGLDSVPGWEIKILKLCSVARKMEGELILGVKIGGAVAKM